MAQIYRPTYRAGGKTRKVKKWYIRYRNHKGKLVKVAGFTDKGALNNKLPELSCVVREYLIIPFAVKWIAANMNFG